MPEISRDDVRHLSQLARLEITDAEVARFATQLSSVVGFVEQLQTVSTAEIGQTVGVTGMHNVLADDQEMVAGDARGIDPQGIVAQSPQAQGRYFQVRAVMQGEEGGA